jgi:hypothetical protein
MFGQPENNPTNLRVVKTARTADAINTAAKAGLRPLVKAVSPSSDIHSMVAVYQHPKTGEIKVSGDVRWEPKEGFESVLPHRTYYPYHFPEAFAAYLLPPDLKDGEPVWLEDVIEDIVAVWEISSTIPDLRRVKQFGQKAISRFNSILTTTRRI